MCVGKLCVSGLCVGKLLCECVCVCVSKLCVSELCVGKLEEGRREEEGEEAGGSAQQKARTPHNDVGKNVSQFLHVPKPYIFLPTIC